MAEVREIALYSAVLHEREKTSVVELIDRYLTAEKTVPGGADHVTIERLGTESIDALMAIRTAFKART